MAVSWQQSTIEVCFIICNQCCQRLEVKIDRAGTSVAQLRLLFIRHWKGHYLMFDLDERWFREQARTEMIDLDVVIDLRDILSNDQLAARARKLAAKSGFDFSSAVKVMRRRISGLVLASDKYICRSCGRYITRRMAERGGYGRVCANKIQAQKEKQTVSSSSA